MSDGDEPGDLSEEDRRFRDEVRDFVARELTPEITGASGDLSTPDRQREWQRRLAAAGLAAISWPEAHGGRGATPRQQLLFATELARHRPPEPINRSAINQLGPTIIQWGTPEQQERLLPRILSGEDVWCQGFSEPDAGSDLASLRTRAVLDGDELVITGQKIWTSKAHYANWIYLLVRTDPDAPKHEGISFVVASLDSPGIEIRPIRQVTGATDFSEVFLDAVRVPVANVIGPLDQGWKVATSTLGYERVGQSRTHRIERRLSHLVRMATEEGDDGSTPVEDDVVCDQIVRFTAQVEALRRIASQATAAGVRGMAPGPEANIAKLLTSEVDQQMAGFGLDLAGAEGVLEPSSPDAPRKGTVALSYMLLRAATLGAGTSEIQRNVIGEKLLGLPRDH